MKLTGKFRMIAKAALEILDSVEAGLDPVILMKQAVYAVGQPITDLERDEIVGFMRDREWIYTYTDKLTACEKVAVRESGRLAAAAL